MGKKTICLNMIVKNESKVIRRCLESVKALIDHWVIVDTGSTDGTQTIIKDYLKDIPGELHERPWVNFQHNRNEALHLAKDKADYLLFIDADDRLVFSKDFKLPQLDKDYYYVRQHINQKENPSLNFINTAVLLIKNIPEFRWEGVVHEKLVIAKEMTFDTLEGVINEYLHDGVRANDPEVNLKDIKILEKAVEEDPSNPRNYFYLARTYWQVGDYPAAIKNFEIRAEMGAPESEVFYSLYCIGVVQKMMKMSPEIFINSFTKAYLYRPIRAEPLHRMAEYYITSGNPFLAYLVSKTGLNIPCPSLPEVFVESTIYDWGLQFLFYISAVSIKKYDEAFEVLQKLLANPRVPPAEKKELESHLKDFEGLKKNKP